MTNPDIYYDPYDYELDAHPHPAWKRMRDEAPLYRNDRYNFYALSRFQDVLTASTDFETFSSRHGTVLEMMSEEEFPHSMMIVRDPPEHTRLRKLVSHAFSPRRIAALEKDIRAIAAGYLDECVGRSRFDYVTDFGAKLPMMVIGTMLGVPREDREQVRCWADQIMHREPGETDNRERTKDVQQGLWGYFARYVAERRTNPRDDMMTDLIEAELVEDGSTRRLTDIELLSFIGLLSVAGNETVARLIGWAGATLARNPGERTKLVANPSLIPNAIEELLRYEAPSPVQGRWVTRDVELHGRTVPAKSRILLLTGSAGRDEREFPDPDRFDVERTIDRHLTFGYGVHFCLGASLARMEGRIALEETFRRLPEWDVDWDAAAMVHTSTVRGWEKLPLLT
ncbi:MAG: cytochrome P450 [Gemmatimonadota bacterium]